MWWQNENLCFCKHCLHHLENHFSLLSFSTSTLWFCCPMRPFLPSDTVVYYRQGNKKQKMYPVNWFQSWCSASWLPLCGGACCHRKKDLCVTESSVCISMLMSVYQSYVCVNGLHKPYVCVFLSSSSSAEMTQQRKTVYSGGILLQILMCAGRVHVVCFIF